MRVEEATSAAIDARVSSPYLGGVALAMDKAEVPQGAHRYAAQCIGYLQHIDMFALSKCADKADMDIYVLLNPGAFVYNDTVLAWSEQHFEAEAQKDGQAGLDFDRQVREAFTIAHSRSFDQDPRFGLAVLSEVGSRALSPATNDPGTALDVLGRTTRLLARWGEADLDPVNVPPEHPRIHVAPLTDDDLFEDAFMLMARDGAGLIEVQLRLRKCLAALARLGSDTFRAAARRQAEIALVRAEKALGNDHDVERLKSVQMDAATPS